MATTLKHSKQREAIIAFLMTRKDHPSADTIYTHLRRTYPNISLGTVYRNLALLSERNEILKLTYDAGADRFDANAEPHYHFVCKKCGAVIDLDMEPIDYITEVANHNFPGQITGHTTFFYGICDDCID